MKFVVVTSYMLTSCLNNNKKVRSSRLFVAGIHASTLSYSPPVIFMRMAHALMVNNDFHRQAIGFDATEADVAAALNYLPT